MGSRSLMPSALRSATDKGLRQIHHGGAFAGFRSEMMRFPERRLTVICLANLASVDPGELAMRVADLCLAGGFPTQPSPAEPPSVKLAHDALVTFAGSYRDPRDGGLWTFVVDDASLTLERSEPVHIPLLPSGPGAFRDKDGQRNIGCEFLPQQGTQPRRVRVRIGHGPERTFEAITRASPTPKELEDYAGTYYSPEVEATFTFVIQNGKLQLQPPHRPRQTLHAGMRDEFAGTSGTLQFERDASNCVTGFRYNLPRVRKLRFDRQSDRK